MALTESPQTWKYCCIEEFNWALNYVRIMPRDANLLGSQRNFFQSMRKYYAYIYLFL